MSASWQQALSIEERNAFLATNNWRSFGSISLNWAIVGAALAWVAASPGVLSVLGATLLIGARQLGFAVLMHEAAHQTLFRNRKLNDFAGNWLCAFPIWSDLRPYRPYHLQHHAKNWTKEDPDLDLATKFPVTRDSFKRKIWRDISGQIGWKRARATLRRDLGLARGKTSAARSAALDNLKGVVITNALLLGLLAALGQPALYLVWVLAWFTTNSLVTRIRAVGEHNMPGDPCNELQNSRTTLASWWERLLIAPNRVNYHLEHHLLMTVPFYNLPKLHRTLAERGVLDDALVERGYLDLLRRAASKPTADAIAA
jgi:fatty acid desaturase